MSHVWSRVTGRKSSIVSPNKCDPVIRHALSSEVCFDSANVTKLRQESTDFLELSVSNLTGPAGSSGKTFQKNYLLWWSAEGLYYVLQVF